MTVQSISELFSSFWWGGRPGGVLPPPPILNLDTTLIIYMYRLPLEVGPYHPERMYRPDVRDGVASLVGGAVDGVLGAWCPLLIRKRCVGLQGMAGRGVNKSGHAYTVSGTHIPSWILLCTYTIVVHVVVVGYPHYCECSPQNIKAAVDCHILWHVLGVQGVDDPEKGPEGTTGYACRGYEWNCSVAGLGLGK